MKRPLVIDSRDAPVRLLQRLRGPWGGDAGIVWCKRTRDLVPRVYDATGADITGRA